MSPVFHPSEDYSCRETEICFKVADWPLVGKHLSYINDFIHSLPLVLYRYKYIINNQVLVYNNILPQRSAQQLTK